MMTVVALSLKRTMDLRFRIGFTRSASEPDLGGEVMTVVAVSLERNLDLRSRIGFVRSALESDFENEIEALAVSSPGSSASGLWNGMKLAESRVS